MNNLRDLLTEPLKVVVSFAEWREKNPDLENWVDCPFCDAFDQYDDFDCCNHCNGRGEVNDLRTLYENDLERDLRLIFLAYDKITPSLKAFIDRFHVDGVY